MSGGNTSFGKTVAAAVQARFHQTPPSLFSAQWQETIWRSSMGDHKDLRGVGGLAQYISRSGVTCSNFSFHSPS